MRPNEQDSLSINLEVNNTLRNFIFHDFNVLLNFFSALWVLP